MGTYFICVEYQSPYSGLLRTNAVFVNFGVDPDDKEFLPAIAKNFADARGWKAESVMITCVSKLK